MEISKNSSGSGELSTLWWAPALPSSTPVTSFLSVPNLPSICMLHAQYFKMVIFKFRWISSTGFCHILVNRLYYGYIDVRRTDGRE